MSSSESVICVSNIETIGVEFTVDAEVVLEVTVDTEVGWSVVIITDKPPLEGTTDGVEVVNIVGMVGVLAAVIGVLETANTLILDCCSKKC